MSLERIKKYCEKFAKVAKVLTVLILIIIICQTVCFMWQALMPGKLTRFFNIFRIYAPFISNIDNNALCLFELAGSLFNNLFVFVMIHVLHKMFVRVSETISLGSVTGHIKTISVILIADAIAVPIMKSICYTVFVKLPAPAGMVDLTPVILGAVLYFIAIIIQSKSVFKDAQE